LHNFGGQNFNLQTAPGQSQIDLYWSDPLGGSSNDYDLFQLNSTGTAVTASSTNIQNGTQDPFEAVPQPGGPSLYVIVKNTGAADRFLHLNSNRGRFSIVTAGQTHGHAAAANAFGCAATPAGAAFPNPFNSSNVVETFSSDGPRRVFFQADGTPITPGDFLATGGLLRQKPDITAADGVSVTGVGGFGSPFFGTSAAAPHAGAIAGLLKSANPSFTPAQIRAALTGSAIDIEAPGVDRDSGAGIIDAFAALQFLGVPGFANVELGAVAASENPGDGNGQIDAGEGARLAIQLKNSGVLDATGVTATLATSTPGVIITQPSVFGYPNLPALGGTGTSPAPFLFTVASEAPCPLVINFTLTVNYTGGAITGPKVFNFTVQTGPPAVSIASTMDAVAPTPGPGFTTTTGTIGFRHFRDGIASSCGSTKAFPGTTQPGTRQYDAYTFETCPTSGGGCVTVTLNGANAINLFSAAYIGNFNPADLSQNYLADAGASAASRTYSFDIPPGQQTFTVVVTDVPPGPPSGISYTLSVSGACIGSCPTVNHPPVAMSHDVTVQAGDGCVADASINNGSFDPDGDPLTITQTPAGPYPLGTTNVLLTVTDSRGAASQSSSTVTVLAPTTTTVSAPAPVQYSDAVTLSSTTFSPFCPTPTPAGSVEFFVDGVSVGSAPVDGGGVATKTAKILLAAGSYPVKAVFTSSNPLVLGSMGISTLTVTKESAVVTPSASNPTNVKVNHPGGTAGPITLCSTVKEASDGSPGDISLATPVTFILTPVVPGTPPITRTATTSGGGVGGTLNACVTLNNVPANVYDVAIGVGGNYYSGSGSTSLVVFDPSPGFVTGAGTISRNGAPAVFAFSAKFKNNGKVEGSLVYAERRQNREVKLEIISIESLAVVGNTGVLIGKAIFNGGDCVFRATVIDNDLLGRHDKFGLQVTTPSGAIIPDLTFDPITLTSGNILVPHQLGNNAALK
ncbi:MAG TPA: post-COAP-1 domain-containing protein, partial [Blastocatellia bacterium]